MKLLIAEDDAFFRRLLQQVLGAEYELCLVEDGVAALNALQSVNGPRLAILDWVMPSMSGPQVCRKLREQQSRGPYLMILTAKNSPADILSGLRAGADDYVTKPFDPEELRARVRVGRRVIELQDQVEGQAAQLRDGLLQQQELVRLLPICPHCHRIRSDANYWRAIEAFVSQHLPDSHEPDCPHCIASAGATVAPELRTVSEVTCEYVRTDQ